MKVLWYTQSILKIGEGKFGQILNRTWKSCNIAVQSRQAQVSQHVLTTNIVNDTDMLDDHALIAVSSDIEVESDSEGQLSPTHFHCFLTSVFNSTRI